MKALNGFATQIEQTRKGTIKEIENYDHAWQVMFAYEGVDMFMKPVTLGPIPGEFPSEAVRQVIIDKHNASATSIAETKNKLKEASEEVCVLCRLSFGSNYDDPNFGPIVVTRNRRNRFYCNTCDLFLRACPGQAILNLPVLVVDVKHSRKIRNNPDVGLGEYIKMLSDFQCNTAAIIQRHLGMVLNTVGDAVIGIWPSGFIPQELKDKYGWDPDNPAKIAARLAIDAAKDLAENAPIEFNGEELPFKGALDTTEMAIFAVQTNSKIANLEFEDLNPVLGNPLIDDDGNLLLAPNIDHHKTERQTGPTAIDIAGEAIEVASELSGHRSIHSGEFAISERTDIIAGTKIPEYTYDDAIIEDIPVRKLS